MKKFLSLVLALVMTMSLVTISAGAKDFTDDESIQYDEAIDVMSAIGVIDGYTDGAFKPTNQLNRGQAAKILCNMILGPTTASALKADAAPFKDVPADSTFAAYIAYCSKAGIIDGYTDGTFRPSAPLTGYAFMKLLLGALGYDKDVEGYNQPNWSINVAKRALAIGLDDGLTGEFDGTKIVTREEACLYALNTLKATLVEYDAKTNISVGGAEVVIAGSKAEPVIWSEGVKNDGNIDDDGMIQFAEQYFPKLTLADNTSDAFSRPSNVWRYKSEKVGTYAKTPAKTYEKNVKLGDIYADLDMTEKDTAEVYINGAEGKAVVVSKANDVKVASKYANKNEADTGSTIEVYYDDDTNDVTICVIDTYVGTVAKSVAAKGNRNAYIVIDECTPELSDIDVKASFKDEFETDEEFEDDAVVLFTYSAKDEAIKSVKLAEKVEGTLTEKADEKDTDSSISGKSINLDGESRKMAKNYYCDAMTFDSLNVKSQYVAYLDNSGNIIYVTEEEFVATDYALILAIEGSGAFNSARVKLLNADGNVKIYNTDKNYTTAANGSFAAGQIVTYKVDDDNEATLHKTSSSGSTVGKGWFVKDTAFDMENNDAAVKYKDASTYVYANSKTVFVVYDGDTYKAYTGLKAAPTIKAAVSAGVGFTGFCKTTNLLTVAFIDASAAGVLFDSEDVIFLAGDSKSDRITTTDGVYYTFNAVINGKITETAIKVDEDVNLAATGANDSSKGHSNTNYLFNGAKYDKYDIATAFGNFTGTAQAASAKGTVKLTGEYTIGFGTKSNPTRFTVSESAKIYKIDTDGDIVEASLASIKTDEDDTVLYITEKGQITWMFVQEVTEGINDVAGSTGNKQGNITTQYTAENGSTASGTYTVASNGQLRLTLNYVAPAWAVDTTNAHLTIDVYAGDAWYGFIPVNGAMTDGKLNKVLTAAGYPDDEALTFKISAESFDAVEVLYLDEEGNDISSLLVDDANLTTELLTAGNNDIQAALDSTKMTLASGVTPVLENITLTGGATVAASSFDDGVASATLLSAAKAYADGDDYAIVKVDISAGVALEPTYVIELSDALDGVAAISGAVDLTGASSATEATVDKFGLTVTGNDDVLKIETDLDAASGLHKYNVVTFTATMDDGTDTAADAATYKVTMTTSAGTLTFTGLKADGSTTKTATLTMPGADVTITGIEVEIETPLVAVASVTKTADNKITVVFNTPVNDGAATPEDRAALVKADFTFTDASSDGVDITTVDHTVDTATVVITVDGALAENDTIKINASSVANTANVADKLATVTYKLNAEGEFVKQP